MKKYSLIPLSLVILGLITVPQPTSAFESRGNTSSAKWVSQIPGSPTGGSTVIYATPGGVLNFALTIKNTSKTDVFYSATDLQDEAYPFMGAHELRVGATNDVVYDNIFDFSYGGPWVNNNRFISFESGAPVSPGGQLTFYWNLKVKSNISNGSYRYAVGIVQEYDAWLGDRPGPGAGGPNNNLGGRSGGTIFWDIVIGGTSYSPDNRILITANSNGYYAIDATIPGGGCFTSDFNRSLPIDGWLPYTNTDKGISLFLPYNPAWGSSKYRINLVDLTSGSVRGDVLFGPIFPFEGCTVIREYEMKFLPMKSANQTVADLIATDNLIKPVIKYSYITLPGNVGGTVPVV